MADENHQVRIEEHLKIKIGEAKNLQARNHGSTIQRDVYCTVSLDQEEIFRTTTMEKTLSPFFGEEFQFEIPRRFRYLSIYIYDRDRHLKQDKVLGKVAIKREDLNRYHSKDHWFAIRPVDADSEVQGKANIEIQFDPALSKSNNDSASRMCIRILECVDLTLKNNSCDPYAAVTVTYSNMKKITKRTKVKKKTTNPHFDDKLTFEMSENSGASSISAARSDCSFAVNSEGEICEVCVALWHDMGMGVDDVFLGEVRIPLRGGCATTQLVSNNAWYYLQPRRSQDRGGIKRNISSCATPPGTRLSSDNSLGSLRLQVYYTSDCVFPSVVYDPLRQLLLNSIHSKPITTSAVYILGEISTNKTEAAQPLVRFYLHHNQIVPIIRELANHEISKLTDPTTIFRGNTLVSKMMDETMKLTGLRYLHTTLRPVMNLVFSERKPCEIDPTRVRDPNAIEANLNNLIEYVRIVFDAIVQSAVHCPHIMCLVFHNLKECATIHFPENREVRYSVISGFIFLRFFAPAILGPRLFDITNEQIDSQTNRTLTLISKTIQSLGNLVSARCAQQTCKEVYMERVHKAFATDKHIQALRQFLEIISASTSNLENSAIDTSVVLKEGVMTKRAQGRKRFGRKNFKQRYFRLTTHDLTYSKTKGKEPLCCIPLADILAVERLNENSFKMKNMFQIVQNEHTLYVQAGNCVEQKEWVDLLTKLCQNNGNRLQSFHPSAYLNGHWMCCNKLSESAAGCSQVSHRETNLYTSLDPDRDLERIYSLIVTHRDRFNEYLSRCDDLVSMLTPTDNNYSSVFIRSPALSQNSANSNNSHNSCIINDNTTAHHVIAHHQSSSIIQATSKTIKQLQDITFALQQLHFSYQKTVARETKYGSKQAPIGDDNYLHLAARLSLDSSFAWRCVDN